MSSLELVRLPEPALEFGDGHEVRIKEGLAEFGPYSLKLAGRHPAEVRIGFVGPSHAVRDAEKFLRRVNGPLQTDPEVQLQRPSFPGFPKLFRSQLVTDGSWRIPIPPKRVRAALRLRPPDAFLAVLDMLSEAIDELGQRDPPPDVILVAIPKDVLSYCARVQVRTRSDVADQGAFQPSLFDDPQSLESVAGPAGLLDRDLRRALKAAAMKTGIPIQIVTPALYAPSGRYDDPASRAWNLSVALFYKAGGVPWRVSDLGRRSLYIGLTFHHRWHVEGHSVTAGLAQAFYPGSEGFALRGGEAIKDPGQLRLRLARDEMERLVAEVLDHYVSRTARLPERVVLHKLSEFDEGEVDGARASLDNVSDVDFVTLRTSRLRLMREGDYPPWRGTLGHLDGRTFLLTTGYQSNRQTYKGSHIPVPLDIASSADANRAARDVLALTKLNWNSAADHGRFPVTLGFAQKVGAIMAEVPDDQAPQTRFSFYI